MLSVFSSCCMHGRRLVVSLDEIGLRFCVVSIVVYRARLPGAAVRQRSWHAAAELAHAAARATSRTFSTTLHILPSAEIHINQTADSQPMRRTERTPSTVPYRHAYRIICDMIRIMVYS